MWWNCLRSAVFTIDTSGERHSHRFCWTDHSPHTSRLLPFKKIWQENPTIRRSVEKITSADFILEIEPKRTSSGKNLTTAKFWRTTGRENAGRLVTRSPRPFCLGHDGPLGCLFGG